MLISAAVLWLDDVHHLLSTEQASRMEDRETMAQYLSVELAFGAALTLWEQVVQENGTHLSKNVGMWRMQAVAKNMSRLQYIRWI